MYVKTFFPLFFLTAVTAMLSFGQNSPTSVTNVPITRVLALGHLTSGTTRDKVMPVMQQEVRGTVKLYLAGKLDQWFFRRDQNGVVFLLNVSSVDEARTLLEALPLGQAKLMEFDLIPLGPLAPLGLLLQDGQRTAK